MPSPTKLSPANAARLRRVHAQIARLPEGERAPWRRLLREKGLSGNLVVVGQEVPPVAPAAAAPATISEWDLKLANWLDNVYTAVAERAEVVGEKAASAVRTAGFSLWPIVIAGAVVVLLLERRRAGKRG